MNTLKEKIKILEAMDRGETIQYSETDGETDEWEDLKTSELDFDLYTYRVKPNSKPRTNPDARFKVGDVLVLIIAEGELCPTRYKVIGVSDNYYEFDCTSPYSIKEADEDFINERDVLWYFEVYDSHQGRWSIFDVGRLTIDEMTKEYAPYDDHIHKFRPFYTLGFSMRELNDNG